VDFHFSEDTDWEEDARCCEGYFHCYCLLGDYLGDYCLLGDCLGDSLRDFCEDSVFVRGIDLTGLWLEEGFKTRQEQKNKKNKKKQKQREK
jgi:hypothetical protein